MPEHILDYRIVFASAAGEPIGPAQQYNASNPDDAYFACLSWVRHRRHEGRPNVPSRAVITNATVVDPASPRAGVASVRVGRLCQQIQSAYYAADDARHSPNRANREAAIDARLDDLEGQLMARIDAAIAKYEGAS